MSALSGRGATWPHVRAIGVTEAKRRWRSMRENETQLVALAIAALFVLPMSAFGLFGAYLLGERIGSGEIETPVTFARLGAVYAWVGVGAIGGFRAYSTSLEPDRLDGMLTTVSHRELIAGVFAAEALLWGLPIVPMVVLASVVFALGAGSAVAAPLLVVGVCLVLVTALATGFGLALAVKNTGVRSKLLTRLRTVLLGALFVAYMWMVMTQSYATVLEPLSHLLEPTPLAWYGDLVLLGTVPDASVGRAAGALVATGGYLLLAYVALSKLAAWLWYADGVSVEQEAMVEADSTVEGPLTRLFSRPVAGVVATDWKRARRAPVSLSFAVYPLFVLIGPATTVVQTGSVGSGFPLLVALCGAWITGALFALNVLGNEAAVLPSTLLSAGPGRALVRGHVGASVLLGAPVTLLATVGLGFASPRSLASVASLGACALVLAVAAPLLATGVGVAFPRFEEVSVTRGTEAIVPSTFAFVGYSIGLVVVAVPGLLANTGLVGGALASWLGTTEPVVAVAGTALTALLALPLGALSARHAVRSVETYHLE